MNNPFPWNENFLEIGPEANRHTGFRDRFDRSWATIGRSEKTKVDFECDLNSGIPARDNSFQIVFCSHVIEHLDSPSFFLSEILRVLKPGCLARINTLDSWVLCKMYLDQKITLVNMLEQMRTFSPGGHQHAFDDKTLIEMMKLAGFNRVQRFYDSESYSCKLRDGYFSSRKNRSIFIEGFKSLE